jgi:hypothetical protein
MTQVTVSSGDPQLTHLACQYDAWACEDPKDDDMFIQWDFCTPCAVTAVVTKGHPKEFNWVTKYAIEFWVETRTFSHLNADVPEDRDVLSSLRSSLPAEADDASEITFFDLHRAYEDKLKSFEITEVKLKRIWERLTPVKVQRRRDPRSSIRALTFLEVCRLNFGRIADDQLKGYWEQLEIAQEEESSSLYGQWAPYHSLGGFFRGNIDNRSIVENPLEPHIETTSLRLRVLDWFEKDTGAEAALRATVFGYPIDENLSGLAGTGHVPEPSRPCLRQTASQPGSVKFQAKLQAGY